jgi:predicted hydrolase (HD superfamily)
MRRRLLWGLLHEDQVSDEAYEEKKAFAASVNRDNIMECEKIGSPIDEFVEPCINARLTISERIGL